MIYVVIELREGTIRDKMEEVANALSAGDWYFSAIAAGADADQVNYEVLEQISQEEYESGNFNLLGVMKFGYEGLVTKYED